jgi:hypothetical protein
MRLSNSLIAIVFFASAASAQSARLLDGHPDMQGMYTRSGVKGLEAEPPFNPIDPGEKNPLSVSIAATGSAHIREYSEKAETPCAASNRAHNGRAALSSL